MPTPATDHDHNTLLTISRWKTIASKTVDDIGGWRNADPGKLDHYWSDGCTSPPSGPPVEPNLFYGDTTYLAGEITARYPKLDPTPLLEVYTAIAAWYADHNADRVPPQPVLFATMERSMMTLQAVEIDIETRAAGDRRSESPSPRDALVTLDQAAAMVQQSKRTLERYLNHGKLPQPDLPGGGGKPNRWYWSMIRPALQKHFRPDLPEKFPGLRVI